MINRLVTVCIISLLIFVSRVHAEYNFQAPAGSTFGVDITLSSAFLELPSAATVPLKLTIRNNLSESGVWTLVANSKDYNYKDPTTSTYTESFSVPASSVRTFEVVIPHSGYLQSCNSHQIMLSITGTNVEQVIQESLPTPHCQYGQSSLGYVGYSNEFGEAIKLSRDVGSYSSTPKSKLLENYTAGELTPEQLPSSARALSGVTVLAFTTDAYQKLNPAQKSALQEWITYGGKLLLLSVSADIIPARMVLNEFKLVGAYQEDSRGLTLGFGRVRVIAHTSSDYIKAEALVALLKSKDKIQLNALQNIKASQELLQRLQIPGMPVLIILLVMSAYAIIVGPYNLFVLSKNRRLFLYITTPVIAILTSLILFAGILFADGVGAKGNRQLALFLYPHAKRQFLIQQQAYQSGLLLSTNFSLPRDVMIYPLSAEGDASVSNSSGYLQGETVNYSGDWFKGRRRAAQLLSVGTTSRWALSLNLASNTISSTLPFEIKDLVIQYEQKTYFIKSLAPGGTGALVEATSTQELTTESRLRTLGFFTPSESTSSARKRAIASGLITPSQDLYTDTLPNVRWHDGAGYLFAEVLTEDAEGVPEL